MFDQQDIVAALLPGHYLTGPYAGVGPPRVGQAPVPEPTTAVLMVVAIGVLLALQRGRGTHIAADDRPL